MKHNKLSQVSDLTIPEWATILQHELDERGNDSFHSTLKYLDRTPQHFDDDYDDFEDYFDPYEDTSFTPKKASKPLLVEGRYVNDFFQDIEMGEIVFNYLESFDREGLKEVYQEIIQEMKEDKTENVFQQSKRWPIEEKLWEHPNILQSAAYARNVKQKASPSDCEIAAIVDHGDCALATMFPGVHLGFAMGACLHDVLHSVAQGDEKKLIKIGRKSIKEFSEFTPLATMFKLYIATLLYPKDIEAGYEASKEIQGGETLPTTLFQKPTRIAQNGLSPGGSPSRDQARKRTKKERMKLFRR